MGMTNVSSLRTVTVLLTVLSLDPRIWPCIELDQCKCSLDACPPPLSKFPLIAYTRRKSLTINLEMEKSYRRTGRGCAWTELDLSSGCHFVSEKAMLPKTRDLTPDHVGTGSRRPCRPFTWDHMPASMLLGLWIPTQNQSPTPLSWVTMIPIDTYKP